MCILKNDIIKQIKGVQNVPILGAKLGAIDQTHKPLWV